VASSLEMAVSRAMDPLTKSLDTFIQGATQEQVEGVRRIVGQFVSQMNAQLSGQMTTLGHTMEMVSQGQLQTQKNLQNTLNAAQAMAADAQSMQVASAQMAQALQSWAEELKNSQTKRTEEAAMLEEQNQNLRQELELLTRSLADMRIAADRLTSELDDQMTQNDLSLPG